MRCGNIDDWKLEAERLKFDEGLSWSELYSVMKPHFPDLTDKQVEERVRGALRYSKRYHAEAPKVNAKDRFSYTSADAVHLYMISDAHVGAQGFDESGFVDYISEIEKDDKAAVVVLGDLIDNATIGSKSCVFSQRMSPQSQVEKIIELLYPIKDKIIFLCGGNHENRTFRQTGSDPSYTICLGLGCLDKYNPVHGFLTITSAGKAYKVYATHNIGRAESRLKTMARAHPDCDLILGGHIHQSKVVPVAQQLHSGKIRTNYAVTGRAWLKDEGYAISAAYEPVSDVQPVIVLHDGIKIVQ